MDNLRTRYIFGIFFIILLLGLVVDAPGLWQSPARGEDARALGIPATQYDLYSECVVLADVCQRCKGTDKWMSDTYHPRDGSGYSGACRETNAYWLYVGDAYEGAGMEKLLYKSNIVVQRFFLYFLDAGLGLDRAWVLTVAFYLNCLLLAACAAVIMVWLSKRVGTIPMLVLAVVMCVGCGAFTISAKSLYWQTWTLYLPTAVSCIFCDGYLSRYRLFRGKKMWLAWMFVLLTLKQACYFELMTTVILAAFIPCILWALEKKQLFTASFLKLCVAFAVVAIASFVLVMSVKLLLLTADLGGFQQAVYHTINNIERRTLDPSQMIPASYTSPLGKIYAILKCFTADFFLAPKSAHVCMSVWLAFHGLCTLLLLPGLRKYISGGTARLIMVQWCAFIALTSWWVLATPHAVIHCHLCGILLWLPFNFVVWATAVSLLRDWFGKGERSAAAGA